MSRNLGTVHCKACPSDDLVRLLEAPRPIRVDECRPYLSYVGMMVANAECAQCEAKYLAWISGPFPHHWRDDIPYSDLSFRAAFNDEPAPEDLPVYEVRRIVTYERVRKYDWCPHGYDRNGESWFRHADRCVGGVP